ncbi:imidazolonepropionase-like amidohydrolase [Neolewinella xylanilytica]|uniref:Imidazolonepropionase-like amidohydrolase n=1 Tax=Neolewinella xylanilytica TaxID=1514080 RepID=A0A2S6IAF7_9BACT|nr:amidohydrolase family protein [Neolewinella xylanilytica]PPK88483.1 imidazolonepropionase-like amidohydrolase [Neolewinella xylanilytica]
MRLPWYPGPCAALSLCLLLFWGCTDPPRYELVLQNVHLFDGHEDRGTVSIGINADTIAVISETVLTGDSIVDAAGKFVMPGLVNAHVHVSRPEQLREGYQLGILYLLNMHTGMEEREADWKRNSRDAAGSSVLYGSGHAATVPGGHPTPFSPDMETINDSVSVGTWIDHRITAGADYIKIIHTERGWMGDPPGPSLSYPQIGEIIEAAHARGYKAVVHATSVEEMMEIAPYRPDGFVHMPDFRDNYPVPENYYATLRESGAFVVTTGGIALKPLDGAPPFVAEWVTENLLDADQRAEIIRGYYDNGIPIVAGTDAQEGQMNFGDDYFLELELYRMAGLPNETILRAATGNAAEAFGLPVGELKEGGPATFLVLSGNPLEEIDHLRSVERIWKNGRID